MLAGPLRHRIAIQSKPVDGATDAYGVPASDWADVYPSVPAAIRPMSGRELIVAQQVAAGVNTEISIRYLNGITAKMRALHRSTCCGRAADEIYDIEFPQDVGMDHRELVLLCSSGLTQG